MSERLPLGKITCHPFTNRICVCLSGEVLCRGCRWGLGGCCVCVGVYVDMHLGCVLIDPGLCDGISVHVESLCVC